MHHYHRSHFGSRYTLGCCRHAGLLSATFYRMHLLSGTSLSSLVWLWFFARCFCLDLWVAHAFELSFFIEGFRSWLLLNLTMLSELESHANPAIPHIYLRKHISPGKTSSQRGAKGGIAGLAWGSRMIHCSDVINT